MRQRSLRRRDRSRFPLSFLLPPARSHPPNVAFSPRLGQPQRWFTHSMCRAYLEERMSHITKLLECIKYGMVATLADCSVLRNLLIYHSNFECLLHRCHGGSKQKVVLKKFAIMELPLLKDVNKQECWWKIISRFARVWEVRNSYTRDKMVQWKVWYPRKSRSIQKISLMKEASIQSKIAIYTMQDRGTDLWTILYSMVCSSTIL